MNKTKIAISIDQPLLELIDSKVDGSIIRSRSQAIEFFLRKGIGEQTIKDAVLLVHKKDFGMLLEEFQGSRLIVKHLKFLIENGINNVYLVTQPNDKINEINKLISGLKVKVNYVYEKNPRGTASALNLVRDYLKESFVVINGDTYNEFNLRKMMNKHVKSNKVATIGLITSKAPHNYSSVTLEGDNVIFFKDKERTESFIINAGIYIFKPDVFNYLKDISSLEREVFPNLTQINELQGYFTYGVYKHFS
ncbi:hypothetical protein CMO89_01770 [Candidatus Woesearchaeota archaeon]|nr:hypothetical protein [Candidatus Woesearchaeota archaeon]|tara:strand:- start:3699 stop:4448 length:750 start_codon:yes stop_codon:yes gene_type:complete